MNKIITNDNQLSQLIFYIRNKDVMLDFVLAELYGSETKILLQSVKRNIERFPEDFMFQMSEDEFKNWRSQFVTSNPSFKMGLRRAPYVFTEQGVAMLSSVLRSPKAIQINIEIMRFFVKSKNIINQSQLLERRIDDLENKYDESFKEIFSIIRNMLIPQEKSKKPIGFIWPEN